MTRRRRQVRSGWRWAAGLSGRRRITTASASYLIQNKKAVTVHKLLASFLYATFFIFYIHLPPSTASLRMLCTYLARQVKKIQAKSWAIYPPFNRTPIGAWYLLPHRKTSPARIVFRRKCQMQKGIERLLSGSCLVTWLRSKVYVSRSHTENMHMS